MNSILLPTPRMKSWDLWQCASGIFSAHWLCWTKLTLSYVMRMLRSHKTLPQIWHCFETSVICWHNSVKKHVQKRCFLFRPFNMPNHLLILCGLHAPLFPNIDVGIHSALQPIFQGPRSFDGGVQWLHPDPSYRVAAFGSHLWGEGLETFQTEAQTSPMRPYSDANRPNKVKP